MEPETDVLAALKKLLRIPVKLIVRQNWWAILGKGVAVYLATSGVLSWLDGPLDQSAIEVLGRPLVSTHLLILLIWISLEFWAFHRRVQARHQDEDADFFESLLPYLSGLERKASHEQIVRLRGALSRLLWVEGRHSERIVLGKATESAAAAIDDFENQVAALVDDLGWTLVAKRDFDEAEKQIEHGRRVADEHNLHYWVAKAYRHSGGAAMLRGDFDLAKKLLSEAEKKSAAIAPERKRLEMLAGIEYARAITAMAQNDLDAARLHVEKSDELRHKGKDRSRIVRSHSLMGDIELRAGNLADAKDHFRRGLRDAERVARVDEIIRNCKGLESIYSAQKNHDQAKTFGERAKSLETTTYVPFQIDNAVVTILKK